MELAYAGLHQLCGSLLDRLDRLPAPQRQALEIAFGLSAGGAPDRFLVGLAVLSLLSEAADERPILCLVDDAQWLDRASALTLAFVARRLLAERVGVIFAAREPGGELAQLPELEVRGLPGDDARALLGATVWLRLDERVSDRIVAETRGNPLALLELPRGLTARQLAGGFGLVEAQGLAGRIEESFVRRVETLSDDARRLLLIAAAEPVGDPLLLLRCIRATRDRGLGRGRGNRRIARARRARDLPSSAGALRRIPNSDQRATPAGPSGPGRGDRRQRRPRSSRVASGHGRSGAQRAGRRGARAVRQPRAGARRPGRGSSVPASLRRSVGRSRAADAACACRCPSELACRHL